MALVDNKVKIQTLLAGINALPEAGSGGGSVVPVLQTKSVIPTKAAQNVTPDTGYDGLSMVDVAAIPNEYIVPTGNKDITANGEHNVREVATVNVNVPAPEISLQSKTATPTTSSQTIKPDSGYDGLSQVTVNAMPTATQATPSISVSSAGLITASATQTAGYVAAGTKSATEQLTTQAAQTITPGTSNKTISSGRYLTGTQTIKGDANLVAGNIKSGVSIFGVAGSYEGSGGSSGGGSVDTCTIVINNEVYNLGHGLSTYAFTTFENGEISINFYDGTTIKQAQYKFENVVCGSIFHLLDVGYGMAGMEFDASISRPNGQWGTRFYVAPTVAGTTATITIYDDD